MNIIDGKSLRDEIRERLIKEVGSFGVKPVLAIIQIGSKPESEVYIASKKKFGESIGVSVIHEKFNESDDTQEVIKKIENLNHDHSVSGILVQLPLPKKFDKEKILNSVDYRKDIDGLGAVNIRKLWDGDGSVFVPATTKGIITLLKKNNINIAGKNVLVIGRSSLVGKPTAMAFILENATVTVAHSKTQNLKDHTKQADIIVSAIGRPKFFTSEYFLPHHVVIDVGINAITRKSEIDTGVETLEDEIPDRLLVGDVDFENVKKSVKAISPVPGGVGPMTVASLFENLIEAYKRKI